MINVNFLDFKTQFEADTARIYRTVFEENSDLIKVKKAKTAIPNLEKIFTATLKISNRGGFQGMNLRDLSAETGISLGAIYSYIESKDRLLKMIIQQVMASISVVIGDVDKQPKDPIERLFWIIRTHLYLSEVMQEWFFFAFMEARNFKSDDRNDAIESELFTEKLLADCLEEGARTGKIVCEDPEAFAAMLKPLLQDWYLKTWKYKRRGVTVDAYFNRVEKFIRASL